MKQTKTTMIVSLFVLSIVAFPVLVNAQQANDGRERGQDRAVQAQMNAQDRQVSVQQTREERTQNIQERVEERRAQVLQDVCERRQEQLNARVPQLANQSTRLLGAMDNIYERVQEFYESGQLTVDEYEALNTSVSDAQMNAEASVQVVTSYEFMLDCDNPSVGDQLYGFREAVTEAREELKTYRAELVGLISSLRAAAAAGQDSEASTEPETERIEENEEDANDA